MDITTNAPSTERKFCIILLIFFIASQNYREIHCGHLNHRNRNSGDAAFTKYLEMKSYMNESVNPCHDFQRFACGNWPEIHPENGYMTATFTIIDDDYEERIENMLNAGVEHQDNEIDIKVKDFYKSCTDIRNQYNAIIDYGDALRAIIDEFGDMPVLQRNRWRAERFNWLEVVGRIAHKYRKSIILNLDIRRDHIDNRINRIYMTYPYLYFNWKSKYSSEEAAGERQEYKDEVQMYLENYLDVDTELAQQTAHEIVEFEIALARGTAEDKSLQLIRDMAKSTTASAMSRKYGSVLDIKKYIKLAMGREMNGVIYELHEPYFRNLVKVLNKTPKRIVANYIYYNLLQDFLLYTNINPSNWLCLQKTQKFFRNNIENMIYRRNARDINSAKVEIQNIWHDLKQIFEKELQSRRLNWIQPTARQKLIEKLRAMDLEVATLEDYNFRKEFHNLRIYKNDYLTNVKNILELRSRNYIASLTERAQPDYGFTYGTPVNTLTENKVRVHIKELLSNSHWNSAYPKVIKYSFIGSVLAHELTHGFDDLGLEYDKKGNILPQPSEIAKSSAFKQRKQCFIDQYSKYSYGGSLLPKSALQSENIADNAGVRIAYSAYLHWLEQATRRNSGELRTETFPQMRYTSKQLFFIGFGQLWCSAEGPNDRNDIFMDVHAPPKYRIIGPLSNYQEFSNEFGCAAGTPMNPRRKCEIY